MREIKFRYVYKGSRGICSLAYMLEHIENCEVMESNEDCELLAKNQQTGLKDKSGVEIYEGDLLNICYTSGSGEWIHDGIYEAFISDLEGIVFKFIAMLWDSHGYNQYPMQMRLSTKNILGTIYSGDRSFLYVRDEYVPSPEEKFQFPFNQEKELAFHSRHFEIIGNIYENPELLEK